jgi:two-component system, sensor histidine kinase and response regulator
MPSHDQIKAPSSPDQNSTKKVLIVEDNQMNQRIAGFMVKNKGLLCDVSSSGSDALEKLKAGKYDLVLMDIEMPGMNGYECTQKIRKELGMELPVVAMTAHDTDVEKEKCKAAGMNDYLAKPIKEEAFAGIISRHLNA